ncbi:type II and III secretion system protein family protein [Burkholderia pyrrocinia]|uniref:type II and III secretion system protein family protein n=1 Tax=Burkholderia pyrrocinia TaxID=60550 RepID=UPI001A9CEFF1|nr:pilus assembly protein N-terminal domain-containing protein [Burkholderia pyrrocinia]
MKVIENATGVRRRALSCLLIGILIVDVAAPALAATARGDASSTINDMDEQSDVLDLYRGEIRMMRIGGEIKRIAIGNGKLLTANVVDGRLMLLAENPGVTSLVVWNAKGIALQKTVRVAKGNVQETAASLRDVLADVPGVLVKTSGPNIILTGMLHREAVGRLKAATQDLPNVIDATTVDEGDALKKTIHFKVQIMELTHNAQERLGIAWDQQIAGPSAGGQWQIGGGAVSPNFFVAGIASTLASTINLALSDGNAYLLAAPELNTKSGGTATFLAGGQVPIPRAGALGTTDVDYKDYGIKLNIKPVVDSNNVISAKIDTEISQIDPTVEYGGYPGFLTRRASSEISLRAGETMAISGLISADALTDTSRLPFLSKIPVIGQLFRSKSFRAKKSDLVVFVTPVISDPSQAPNTGMLGRANRIDGDFRKAYGDTSPLVEKDDLFPVESTRHPIMPTPPAPVQSIRRVTTPDAAPAQAGVTLVPASVPEVPVQAPAAPAKAVRAVPDAPAPAQKTPAPAVRSAELDIEPVLPATPAAPAASAPVSAMAALPDLPALPELPPLPALPAPTATSKPTPVAVAVAVATVPDKQAAPAAKAPDGLVTIVPMNMTMPSAKNAAAARSSAANNAPAR